VTTPHVSDTWLLVAFPTQPHLGSAPATPSRHFYHDSPARHSHRTVRSASRRLIPLTVLLVDDDPDMRHYLRTCLGGPGLDVERVLEAADGVEALRLVRSGGVDLVISDIVVPGLDGRALCRAIRAIPELDEVAVLLISGEDGAGSSKGDADGFLAKPFNSRQLMAALEDLIPGR
jgi:two-component system chemotaxis response regulator CheY